MWRPFVYNLANHAYENYVKKVVRADSERFTPSKSFDQKQDESLLFISEEAKQRNLNYENLKKKVKKQRLWIKNQEVLKKNHAEIKLQLLKENQIKLKNKKNEQLRRIRAMSSCKPTRTTPAKSVFSLTCIENCRKLDPYQSLRKPSDAKYKRKLIQI